MEVVHVVAFVGYTEFGLAQNAILQYGIPHVSTASVGGCIEAPDEIGI